jgi:hypothetical protein
VATKELKMLDEGIDDEEFVSLVLSDRCELTRNVLNIPRDEALSYASNILIQLELNTKDD